MGRKKKTHEEFVAEIKELVGDNYIVCNEYTGIHSYITFFHVSCGNDFTVQANSFLNYETRCPCERTNKFLKKLQSVHGNEYELRSEYVSCDVPVTVFHRQCEEEYEINPSYLLRRGNMCQHCRSKRMRKEHDNFVREVIEKTNNEFEVVDTYIDSRTPIRFRHKICGTDVKSSPGNFLFAGGTCPVCKPRGGKLSHEEFISRIREIHGDEFIVIGNYSGIDKEVEVIHQKCGSSSIIKAALLVYKKNGHYCSKCNDVKKTRQKQFEKTLESLSNGEFDVVGKYKNRYTEVTIRHKSCGEKFNVIPRDIKRHDQDRRKKLACPKCRTNMSSGEESVRNFLNKTNLTFEYQYRITGCRNTLPLPFDFAVFNGGNLRCLIEYDGEQHYDPIFGVDAYVRTKQNDNIKNEYCAKNGIKLIRIPYWDFDRIEEILSQELSALIQTKQVCHTHT